MNTGQLKRSITLPFLVLYGVGTIVGGGFYALLGKVAVEAGMATPLAVSLTGLLALLSAFSFAELSSRYPVSAGEAEYVRKGFGHVGLSTFVGWLVILTGVVSAATLAVATVGFLQDMFTVQVELSIFLLVVGMGLVAGWGIGQSVAVVTIITLIEVGALIYAFVINADALNQFWLRWPEILPDVKGSNQAATWIGILSGAFLAFYAFIGFEDMVNMAEEVRDVRRTLPIAILASIILTTVLYVLVSLVAVLSVPIDRLAESHTPLAVVVGGAAGPVSAVGIWGVSLLTGLNGALVQIIMASRVAYGLASKGQAPAWLATVNLRTRTPLPATAAMTAVVLALALFLPLTTLAKITSAIILVVFSVVNLSLWRIKRDYPDRQGCGPRFPRWLPLLAFIVTVLLLLFQVSVVLRTWYAQTMP